MANKSMTAHISVQLFCIIKVLFWEIRKEEMLFKGDTGKPR